jgi:hypothetical protein
MMSKSIQAVALILVGLLLAQILNCTVIGYQIGSSIDNKKPDQLIIAPWELATIKMGTEISMYMQDNFLTIGEFIGVERLPADEYAKRYSEFWGSLILDFNMPKLHDTIAITLISNEIIKGNFVGFDYRFVARKDELASEKACDYYTLLTSQGGVTTKVDLNQIAEVEDQNGYGFKGTGLMELAATMDFPIISAIAYKEDLIKELVPLDDIRRIKIANEKNAKWNWMGYGAMIDIAIITAIAIIAKNLDIGTGPLW